MKKKKIYYKQKRHSKGEYEIALFLDDHKITYIKEKTFPCLVSDKGNKLRVDFYLPDYNTVIEFQGKHHFTPVNKYRRAQRVHDITVKHDNYKRQYFAENNIKLITINDIDLVEYILLKELKHKNYDKFIFII